MTITSNISKAAAAALVMMALSGLATTGLRAQEAVSIQLSIKNKQFQPREITAPANQPIRLTIKNLDPAAVEFESVTLRVEKVIAAGSEGVVNLRPLSPGRYDFFDDFNPQNTGTLVVR